MINESMYHGDLKDLILPFISVDEFESKLDDNALVIGFYVSDQNAAKDLNRFLQKSAADILDSDVSPAPDQKGYYMVFVEILKNKKLFKTLEGILTEVSSLTEFSKWKMHVRKAKKLLEFNKENLETYVGQKQTNESLENALSDSILQSFEIQKNILTLNSLFGKLNYKLLGFEQGSGQHLNEAVSLSFQDIMECDRLSRALGEHWFVEKRTNVFYATNKRQNNTIVLETV